MLLDLIDRLFDTKVRDVLSKKHAKPIMACTNPEIPLFSDEYLSKLAVVASLSESLTTLKIYLLPFVTWFNYSVLTELVKRSGDKSAYELLDTYESHIDLSQPIKSYPFAIPSHLMIPNNDTFTFVVTKCTKQLHTLSDIEKIQKLLISNWKITFNAIQLLTVKDAFLYWMIPTCVKEHVEAVSNDVAVQNMLWQNGVTISTFLSIGLSGSTMISDELQTEGPFSFLGDIMVSICVLTYKIMLVVHPIFMLITDTNDICTAKCSFWVISPLKLNLFSCIKTYTHVH